MYISSDGESDDEDCESEKTVLSTEDKQNGKNHPTSPEAISALTEQVRKLQKEVAKLKEERKARTPEGGEGTNGVKRSKVDGASEEEGGKEEVDPSAPAAPTLRIDTQEDPENAVDPELTWAPGSFGGRWTRRRRMLGSPSGRGYLLLT